MSTPLGVQVSRFLEDGASRLGILSEEATIPRDEQGSTVNQRSATDICVRRAPTEEVETAKRCPSKDVLRRVHALSPFLEGAGVHRPHALVGSTCPF